MILAHHNAAQHLAAHAHNHVLHVLIAQDLAQLHAHNHASLAHNHVVQSAINS